MSNLPPPPPQPPPPYQGAAYAAPDHPQALLALILGIVALVACQLVGPFAWSIGRRVVNEVDASGGQLGGRQNGQIGMVLGIIATAILGVFLLGGLLVVIVAVASSG